MRRLIIADHPGVPETVAKALAADGDVELVNLPFWEDSCLSRAMRLHGLTSIERNAVTAHAERLLRLLRDALLATGTGEEEWQYFRQVLEAHAVTPIAEGIVLASARAERFRPDEVVAVIDVAARDFWSGQAVAPHAAAAAASSCGTTSRRLTVFKGRRGLTAEILASLAPLIRPVAIAMHAARILRRVVEHARSAARPLTQRADVLFVTFGRVTAALASKIASRLADRGLSATILCDPLAISSIPKEFGAFGSAASHSHPLRPVGVLTARTRAARTMAKLSAKLDAIERAALWPRLISLEARDRPLVRWLLADARLVLDNLAPRVVVAFHFYPRSATPYLVEARRRGIPTICCQHGLIASLDYPVPWFDRVAVFNRYTADLIRPAMPENTELTIVGNPSLDSLVLHPPAPVRPANAANRPVVVVATQPNDQPGADARPRWWFRHVAQAAAACNAYLTIKLHPDQPAATFAAMYEKAIHTAGAAGEIIEHGQVSLSELIAGGDVFVSQFSSSILEAIVLGRPVIFVEMHGGPPFYPFDDFGAARRATSPSEIEQALREAIARGPTQPPPQFIQRHLDPLDGRALERMAQEIAHVCHAEVE